MTMTYLASAAASAEPAAVKNQQQGRAGALQISQMSGTCSLLTRVRLGMWSNGHKGPALGLFHQSRSERDTLCVQRKREYILQANVINYGMKKSSLLFLIFKHPLQVCRLPLPFKIQTTPCFWPIYSPESFRAEAARQIFLMERGAKRNSRQPLVISVRRINK